MIRSLSIDNFALMKSCEINFSGNFTVITGETGSGKSILLNSLGLVLGDRADFSLIGKHKDKAVVEMVVDISGYALQPFFEGNELDYFDEAIIRREITRQGRSRAFINDVPVQLNQLKELVGEMVYIHSQYNTLELKDKSYQLKVYDILSNAENLKNEFGILFQSWKEKSASLELWKQELAEINSKSDYNNFQLLELESLNLDSTDYHGLESKLKVAQSSNDLKSDLIRLISLVEGDNELIVESKNIARKLSATESEEIEDLGNRLNSVFVELTEISREAADLSEKFEFSEAELAEMSAKLDAFLKSLQKHRLNEQEDLVALRNELNEESISTSELERKIKIVELELQDEWQKLKSLGNTLSEFRLEKRKDLANELQEMIRELKLENTRVEFKFEKNPEPSVSGFDELQILFSPNPGSELVPIHKAASGGELSRVMLALQNILSKKIKLRSVLFDEIDTGVSGEVAQKVGQVLKSMGEGMQVIAITHLPQVAAKGLQHLRVVKSSDDSTTTTIVLELTEEERVEEIARLMSGESINEGALMNARALMS